MRGELSQGKARVADHDLGQRHARSDEAGSQGRSGAPPERLFHVFVAVEALTTQRDEELSRADRAAVGGDPGVARVAVGLALDRARRFAEIHHVAHAHVLASVHRAAPCQSASAARATSRSLKGWRTPAISW